MKMGIWEATTGGNLQIKKGEGLERGIQNWLRIFGGDSIGEPYPNKDYLLNFDVLISPLLHETIPIFKWFSQIRGNKTKPILILIADPTPPTFNKWYLDQNIDKSGVETLLSGFKISDYVMILCEKFIPFYTQVDVVWRGMNFGPVIPKDKKWVYIPHPINVEKISKCYTKEKNQRKFIGVLRHIIWTELNEMVEPVIKVLNIPQKRNIRLMAAQEKNLSWVNDFVPAHQPYEIFMDKLSECIVGLDNYVPSPQYGEISREFASVGVPCVGNIGSEIQSKVFPSLSLDDNDYNGMAIMIEKLIAENDFYDKMTNEGLKNVQQYNYENSERRMKEFLSKIGVDIE